MRIVCISDTHTLHRRFEIPDGDLLLHAGDLSSRGREHEIQDFNEWLGTLPHRHKVIIAGNHDFMFDRKAKEAEKLITNAHYLKNSAIEIEGIRIWGSPITPWFYDWAFNRHRGAIIRHYWEMIPTDTDILLTHGPPKGILDQTVEGDSVGCADLMDILSTKLAPKLVVFGHIHEGYGQIEQEGITYINAALVDVQYRAVNAPIVYDWRG